MEFRFRVGHFRCRQPLVAYRQFGSRAGQVLARVCHRTAIGTLVGTLARECSELCNGVAWTGCRCPGVSETPSPATAAEARRIRRSSRQQQQGSSSTPLWRQQQVLWWIRRPLRQMGILNRNRLFGLLSYLAFCSGTVPIPPSKLQFRSPIRRIMRLLLEHTHLTVPTVSYGTAELC